MLIISTSVNAKDTIDAIQAHEEFVEFDVNSNVRKHVGSKKRYSATVDNNHNTEMNKVQISSNRIEIGRLILKLLRSRTAKFYNVAF